MTLAPPGWAATVYRDSDNTIPLDPLVVTTLCGSPPVVMGRYKRRPDPCPAAQWFPGREIPGVGMFPHGSGTAPAVKTATGWHFIQPGEWVVRFGDDGQWAVFTDTYFRATFEPAEE